jgi:hypothetical protein
MMMPSRFRRFASCSEMRAVDLLNRLVLIVVLD